jgi:hypothetical protein
MIAAGPDAHKTMRVNALSGASVSARQIVSTMTVIHAATEAVSKTLVMPTPNRTIRSKPLPGGAIWPARLINVNGKSSYHDSLRVSLRLARLHATTNNL